MAENSANSAGGTDVTDGSDGTDGTDGSDGSDGSDGDDGEDGADGTDGSDGSDGSDGDDGEDGADGTDGSDGTDGADGEDGADGADGATGPQGPKGDTGTANVIYSDWFSPSSWIGSGSKYAYFDKSASDIKQSIIDKGVILAYVKLAGDGGVMRPLPTLSSSTAMWNYLIPSVGKIRFDVRKTSGATISPSTSNEFRYIIIPGGKSVGINIITAKGLTESDLRKMSYEEVAELFNISE